MGTKVKIIAHRGASGYAPENTLASFRHALKLGAAAIELDVQQTKDGRLAVIHDLDLKRTAGLRKSLGAATSAELASLDAGSWFDPKFSGEKIPMLDQVLKLCDAGGRKIELHLEIKQGKKPYPGIEAKVLELLSSKGDWLKRTVISSFDHPTLRRARDLSSKARLGYLVGTTGKSAALEEAAQLRCESMQLSRRQADAAWIGGIHNNGMKALVYTINEAAELRRLAALGVDGVFSNFPDLKI